MRGVRVPMATLRDLATNLGWDDVSTHLNDGNLLLSTDDSASTVAKRLHAGLADTPGIDTPVLVRSPRQPTDALGRNPFADPLCDERRVQVRTVRGLIERA